MLVSWIRTLVRIFNFIFAKSCKELGCGSYLSFFFMYIEVVIAPPALYLDQCRKQAREEIGVAAQNAFNATSGAYTGEVR
jgi:hypothetical protein